MATQNILTARTEFASALNQICSERGIEPEVVLDTIRAAILAAYRKDYGFEEGFVYKAEVNPENGEAKIFRFPVLEEVKPAEDGEEIDSQEAAYDETKKTEVTPPGFGRIASQTAKQVILQKIREAEKAAIISEFEDRVGTLVSGMVLRRDGQFIIVDIGRGQALLPPQDQVRNEKYGLNRRMTFYIADIRDTIKGKQIIVSRSAPELVSKLFEREVPEVASGAVEIRKIAREAGERTKIAVFSSQSGVDPVGSCVGQKGVRVQTVIDELNGEKIDIIQYSDDPVRFLISALAPAENLTIDLDEENKEAVVTVPEDQLSLAIGREGQNVRLAAKLTGYKIDIKGPGGMLTESEKKKEAASKEKEEDKESETPKKAAEKTEEKLSEPVREETETTEKEA
ncbi:MAG: transcription termination factor NusA [Patescibacteria group bacterium]|jgi:N utilization substance protein A